MTNRSGALLSVMLVSLVHDFSSYPPFVTSRALHVKKGTGTNCLNVLSDEKAQNLARNSSYSTSLGACTICM